jgi:hypothetical protein
MRSWSLGAAVLFAVSAVLQGAAAAQRWIVAAGSWGRPDTTVEDHRYDYWWPSEPFENLQATAQLFGLGMLALAAAAYALGRSVRSHRDGFSLVLVWAVVVAFGVAGVHALLSGMLGEASALQLPALTGLLSLVAFVALVVLGVRWAARARFAAVAAVIAPVMVQPETATPRITSRSSSAEAAMPIIAPAKMPLR